MNDIAALVIPTTEEAYTAWVATHPHGFVINAWKVPDNKPSNARSMMWHRADCSHIEPGEGIPYVTRDTMKVCATDPGPLAVWAKNRSEPLEYCKDCQQKWQSAVASGY